MATREVYQGLRERLEQQLRNKQEEYAALSRTHFQEVADITLQLSLVNQALLDQARQGTGAPSAAEIATAPTSPKGLLNGDVPKLILKLLSDAEPVGLTGGELNQMVGDAGYSKDSAEKNKTKIRLAGRAYRDRDTGRWRLGPGPT